VRRKFIYYLLVISNYQKVNIVPNEAEK